ncbi:50S ribosomal protein L24 [Candidatus Microgenomates bacterium]|nr:50S ribosomal protein L24 [Candidatus Microgenomates bacterium]
MKFITGDEIIVTRGKDKGRKGTIDKLLTKENRVLVGGVNVYKKHKKSIPGGQKGGIIEFSRPLPVSNVALICPNCTKPTRIGALILKDGKKVRVCKKCNRQIEKKERE